MKKLAASIFSMILIFSVGTTTALAEPDIGVLSATEEEDLVSEQEAEENNADQDNGLNDDEPSEEPGAEDVKSDELDEALGIDDIDEEEPPEGTDSLTEEEEEEQEESEEPEENEEEETEVEELAVVPFDVEDYVEYKELSPQELFYDDRYDLSEDGFPAEGTYVIYKTEFAEGEGITSNQVANGTQEGPDEELLTFKEEGSTIVIASGIGSGTVWLVRDDQKDALDEILSLEEGLGTGELDPIYVKVDDSVGEDSDEEESDDENPGNDTTVTADLNNDDVNSEIPVVISDTDEMITVYQIHVTVEPATLTLMFLTGQSNMEGECSSSTGYQRGSSIACEAGTVYSTYAPSTSSDGTNIGGVSEACTAGNASEFVAGSLQGSTNMSGGELPYPLNSLTTEGNGKTGPDSGMANEWNQLTGDKVWVVNTAYSGTNISGWIPGGTYYERSVAVWNEVLQTYGAEVGNHYTAGEKLVFWLQGETGDRTLAAEAYESYFDNMYNSMCSVLNPTAFGIIMVRASTGSYTTEDEWEMTGPRIAQYWLGSGDSGYSNVYVVSNVNEQWVSDSGVASYFQGAYPGGSLSYPMHGGDSSLPGTVNAVHSNIHYSQVGHNENGITAADGMYGILYGGASPTSVSWRDKEGQEISSLSFDLKGETATMVETVEPSYAAKSVSYDYGSCASYDGATATLTGMETGLVTALYNGSTLSELTVNVDKEVSENYTGFYEYNGVIWYLIDGKVQPGYEGVVQDTEKVIDSSKGWWYVNNGKLDRSYTGFAENSNGWWYIEDGKVTFNRNSVIQDTNKKIDGTNSWWYVVGSQVQTGFTGLANYSNSNGWWYINNGKVTFDQETVAHNNNGWYYVKDSKVQFSYNGFAHNENGWWYCESGKVNFNKNSVIQDTNKKIDGTNSWWYVVDSQVQTKFTGLADYSNSNGWWYINNGKVTFDQETVAENKNGWFYVKDSKVQFSYNGFAHNENGWWYIESGKVTFSKNSVIQDTGKKVDGTNSWWYVVGSQVQTNFTGLADYSNSNGWWYIEKGKVTFTKNTIAQNKNGWYYVKDSKVDFSFTGLADFPNENGWWYIENGKVNFNKNTIAQNKNGWYYIVNSQVDFSFTGLADFSNSNGWWYCENGKVNFNYNGIAKNKNGWFYIKNSKVDFSYNGTVTAAGKIYSVKNGKVAMA